MIILVKYINFADVILKNLVIKLFKHFNINEHNINLEQNK